MKKEIAAYSIQQAFAYLQKELKDEGKEYPKNFVDISSCDHEDHDYLRRILPDLGTAVGWVDFRPEDNPNQIQTQVKDTVVKGEKKWETVYLAVYDTPWGDEVVPNSKQNTKKACVDIAREASTKENRDTFVLIGKSASNFKRMSAQVLYKPSPKQKPGNYIFEI